MDMNKLWYKLSGILVLLSALILIYAIVVDLNGFPEIIGFSILAIIVLFSGIYLLKLSPKKYNKLTNSVVILILIGIIWILFVQIYELVIVKPTELRGLTTIILGVFPAGILYGIALLLLIINWFKNR